MSHTTLPTRTLQRPDTVKEPDLYIDRTESLEDYRYSPLVGQDIRVLELLPGDGDGDEEVRIRIRHCSLRERPSKEDPRMSLAALQQTLPQNWEVRETVEGRYLFLHRQRNSEVDLVTSTWRHPETDFDVSKYEQVSDLEGDEEDTEINRFEALSYAWGQPQEEPLYLRVEDISQHFKLSVWPNLMSALRQLRPRYTETSRSIWVDAICLNQNNLVEKELHIPRMRDIYRLAYRTVVWLGPQSDATGPAFDTVQRIASEVEICYDGYFRMLPPPSAVAISWSGDMELPSLPVEAWKALISLLYLSWFSRLWVVQEVQLSNHGGVRGSIIYWGSCRIELIKLFKVVHWVFYKYKRGWPLGPIITGGREIEQVLPRACSLLRPRIKHHPLNVRDILREYTRRECRDERDRIYGLLGVAGSRFSEELNVSYDDAYGVTDVNRDAFLTHTRLTGCIELLDPYASSHRQVLADAPSWVPGWTHYSDSFHHIVPTFPAHNTRAHIKHEKDSPDILRVLGVQCAVIDKVTEVLDRHVTNNPCEAVRHVRSWQPHDLDTAFYKPTGETMRVAYAITLRQGDVDVRIPYALRPKLEHWVEQDYHDALFGSRSVAQDSDQASPVTSQTLHRDVQTALEYCTGRRFFGTEEGYMGMANRETRKGDIVAILLGCVTPVVLRPVSGTEGQMKFSFVSECFVHGLHDSIKISGPLPRPWRGILRTYRGGRTCLRFQNTENGKETWQDPRLPPLGEWKFFVPEKVEQHHPYDPIFLRHRSTGEEITYDPRLEPEHLEARGIDLTWFTLV